MVAEEQQAGDASWQRDLDSHCPPFRVDPFSKQSIAEPETPSQLVGKEQTDSKKPTDFDWLWTKRVSRLLRHPQAPG